MDLIDNMKLSSTKLIMTFVVLKNIVMMKILILTLKEISLTIFENDTISAPKCFIDGVSIF